LLSKCANVRVRQFADAFVVIKSTAVPSQDGEVHDTRHRFDRQLALALALTSTATLATATAIAIAAPSIHCAHESPAVQALGRSIGPRPANLLGLNAFDRPLACYSCIQMTQMPRPTFLFVSLAGISLGLYF